jgi:hypothetical protein
MKIMPVLRFRMDKKLINIFLAITILIFLSAPVADIAFFETWG